MLQELTSSILTGNDVYTISTRISDALSEAAKEDYFLSIILEKVKSLQMDLSDALSYQKKSEYTATLTALDEARDKAFIRFRDYIKVNTLMSDSTLSEAASLILEKIQERGVSLHRFALIKQSAQSDILFKELDKLKDTLDQIKDAGGLLADLKKAQADFEQVYSEKAAAESKKILFNTNEIKNEICYYLNGVISYLDINQNIGPEKFKPVAAVMDEIVTDMLQNARLRKARNDNQRQDEINPPDKG
jgi:hypothetical protein